MRSRRARAVLLGLASWLLAAVVTAGPAVAHAELRATTPGDGASLESAPGEVTLEFTEPVSLGAGHVRLLDGEGHLLPTGSPIVDGATVTLPLPEDLGDGGFLVTYRVISADSHPVTGTVGFVVGDGAPVDAGLATAAGTDAVVAALVVVARWLGYAGLALALGVPAFLMLCWPAGWTPGRLRRLATAGALAVAAGGVLAFLGQGPYTAGLGLRALVDPTLLGATASETYGRTVLVRVVLALALVAALRAAPRRAALDAGVLLGAGLVVTTAAVGHPVAGPAPVLGVAVTAVHIGAMALWTGGLAALLAGLLRPGVRAGELAGALPRFSGLALGAVVALVLSGVVQTVREVGSPTALVSTTYGWVLVAKLLLFFAVLAAAGVSRVWVQQHLGAPRPGRRPARRVTAHAFAAAGGGPAGADEVDDAAEARAAAQAEAAVADLRPFRRTVLIEAAVVAVVLVLSALLAGTPPARSAVADPVDVTLPLEGTAGTAGMVQISLDPARTGPNAMHLYLFDAEGRLTQPAEVRVSLTEQQQQIGPLDVDLAPAGPGHYVAEELDIPGAGTWTLAVAVRLDEFTATSARTPVAVR